MRTTLRARWHYRLGGWLCRVRGAHHLALVEHHELVVGQGERIERRPFCSVCWRMPAD